MKRFAALAGALLFSALLVGCAPDSKEGQISDTIRLIDLTTTEVSNIRARVKDATEKAKESRTRLNLTDAMSAAKKLKETGEEANRINKRIEKLRTQVSDADKKTNAEREGGKLNESLIALQKQKQDLQVQLALAEALEGQIPGEPRREVQNLRDKIRDAESPFESLLQVK